VSLAVLTPFTADPARQAGGKWRKKLLPIGEINYKGRVLKFTRDYLAGLVKSFGERAYDQVPFQLADQTNTHTNDPERTRGQVTAMSLEPDGLWIEMDPTAAGNQVLATNPGLGVSARIVEGYDRSDGKFFPRAIQHVLGTLDPRIPGLGGWAAVEAANDAEVTYDLSGERFTTRKEPGMPELTDEQNAKLAKLLNLDPDALAALVASMEPGTAPTQAGLEGQEPGDGDGDEDAELDALAAQIENMTPEELEALERELEAEDEPEAVPAGLSNEAALALELAQATGDENARQLSVITAQLDSERWQNERQRLVASGTPPFIADLAQPLLEGGGHTVDLSNGKSVDAGQIMRRVLTEYAKIGQQLGIGVELGTPMDGGDDGDTEVTKAREDVVSRAKAQLFGMG
jgi:hypothetical protein